MASPFLKPEYDDRLSRVYSTMATRGLDALVIADPENINWFNAYDAWSFYTPPMILIDMHNGQFLMGIEIDDGAMG